MLITLIWILFVKVFGLLNTTGGTIAFGVISTFFLAFWIMYIYDLAKYDEQTVDIFKPKEEPKNEKSKSLRGNRGQLVDDDEDDEFR